ncbi:hypothetical protein H0H87_009876 [Tephrocybe sp. NHM501043]|nr:hypothetical protein H0H87_009876 [Tephrocybe sp. NHM501043]
MYPPDNNNPTAQPTAVPDGKKPSSRIQRLLDRSKSTESSSAAGSPVPKSLENLTASNGKSSALKRLSEALKSNKSGSVTSTRAARSVGVLAGERT